MQRRWYIYELRDPRTGAVRYVGWCYDVAKRVRDHVRKARSERTHKARWLMQLAANGLAPVVVVVESGDGDWAGAERRWVASHREQGADLTNATDGGEGVTGIVFSAEARAKMAAAKRGRKQTVEHVERAHAPLRGRARPPHVLAALLASRIGKPRSEATKRKLRVACSGWKHSAATRASMSAAHKGLRLSAETRAKISAAKRARSETEA